MTFYNKKMFKAAGLTMPEHPTWDQIVGLRAKAQRPVEEPIRHLLARSAGLG